MTRLKALSNGSDGSNVVPLAVAVDHELHEGTLQLWRRAKAAKPGLLPWLRLDRRGEGEGCVVPVRFKIDRHAHVALLAELDGVVADMPLALAAIVEWHAGAVLDRVELAEGPTTRPDWTQLGVDHRTVVVDWPLRTAVRVLRALTADIPELDGVWLHAISVTDDGRYWLAVGLSAPLYAALVKADLRQGWASPLSALLFETIMAHAPEDEGQLPLFEEIGPFAALPEPVFDDEDDGLSF